VSVKDLAESTDACGRTLSRMAELSTSAEEWNERAALANYRCRGCQNLITFGDQSLYFVQGYCTPCFEKLPEGRFFPKSEKGKLDQSRDRSDSV